MAQTALDRHLMLASDDFLDRLMSALCWAVDAILVRLGARNSNVVVAFLRINI